MVSTRFRDDLTKNELASGDEAILVTTFRSRFVPKSLVARRSITARSAASELVITDPSILEQAVLWTKLDTLDQVSAFQHALPLSRGWHGDDGGHGSFGRLCRLHGS
jgi:hypothetical protein